MRMRNCSLIARCVLIGCFVIRAISADAQCLDCFYNQQPMLGGCCDTDPTGLGRRVINIQIDSSWDTSPGHTDANVWNSVNGCSGCNPPQGGAGLWNNATDGANPPYHTVYYFQGNQGTSSPDIIIKKDTTGRLSAGACAGTDVTVHPMVIYLPANATSIDQVTLASRIAHEIGHTMGLDEGSTAAGCANKTIMDQANANCASNQVNVPTSLDVVVANQFADNNRRDHCGQYDPNLGGPRHQIGDSNPDTDTTEQGVDQQTCTAWYYVTDTYEETAYGWQFVNESWDYAFTWCW
jgi:hypothetical protein